MFDIVKSEFLKSRNTSTQKFVIFTPLIVMLIPLILGGGPEGAYNWWYVMLYPGLIGIISSQVITREKNLSYKGIFLYSINRGTLWLGKILYVSILVIISSLIFCVGTIGLGMVNGTTISIDRNMIATLILIVTCLFQIPINMFLTARFNSVVAIIFNLTMSTISTVSFGSHSLIRFSPYGIGQYLMVPILNILPNGLPAPRDMRQMSSNMIWTKAIVALAIFALINWSTMIWFRESEVK